MKRGNNEIIMEWLNQGVAPSYHCYGIVFKLENHKTNEEYEIVLDHSGNMNWMPSTIFHENYTLSVPENVRKGRYRLSFKLREMNTLKPQDVLIGVSSSRVDKNNFVFLGDIEI
jgi:repressor of nif and glnA expression